jgi:hypothetical protein
MDQPMTESDLLTRTKHGNAGALPALITAHPLYADT